MRRKLTAACVVLVTAVTGCATGGQSNTEQAADDAPANLVYWNTGGDDETATFQRAADLYKQSHPNVTIKVQSISWDDAFAKMLAAASSRSGPDIVAGGLTWMIQFGARGGMTDLRKQGIESLKAQAHPLQWKSATSPDGSVYGVPLDMSTHALYYRTDLFEKAGLSAPPKTWDELTHHIDKLRDAGIKKPFSIDWGNMDWIGYANYLYQAGGNFYTPDCKPSLNTPQAEQALSYWVSLYDKYRTPTATVEGATALETNTAMVSAGSWVAMGLVNDKPKLKGKWAMATLPAGPAAPTVFLGGRAVGVTSYSKHAKQAADFIKFLYSDQAVKTVVDASRSRNVPYISARMDLIKQSTFLPEHAAVLEQSIRTGAPAPGCPGWDESAPDVSKQLQSAILGKADIKTALAESAKIMERNAG
jgi:multiple sugar transport system substrate-binding protein